jgi:hypothetical protein
MPEKRRVNAMKNFLFNVGLIVCSVILAVIILEVCLRIFYTQEAKRSVAYDTDLGWGGTPFAEGEYIRKADSTRARYRYNELGFRDELLSSLPDSSVRLVLLGDSFVESLEVDYDSTFHRRVEHMLKRKFWSSTNITIKSGRISSSFFSTREMIFPTMPESALPSLMQMADCTTIHRKTPG